MGVTKQMITPGNGTDKPKAGDTITMEYTGNLYDEKAENKKGNQCVNLRDILLYARAYSTARFDSSVGRGDFRTKIGVGQVIRGTQSRLKLMCFGLVLMRSGRLG